MRYSKFSTESADEESYDIRGFTQNMIAATSSEEVVRVFSESRKNSGICYKNPDFSQFYEFAAHMRFNLLGLPLEGPVFKADSMDEKWDVYYYDPFFYFVRAWTGILAYVIEIKIKKNIFEINRVYADKKFSRNIFSMSNVFSSGTENTLLSLEKLSCENVFFILMSHVSKYKICCYLPGFINNNISDIAQYSYNLFGKRAEYASFKSLEINRVKSIFNTDFELLDSDILDVPAECFVSSGNTELKMTGGVNGALLSKYGPELQYELDEFKINKNIKYVTPGFIYSWNQKIRPYKKVLYCAGVDFFYKSSIDLVVEIMKESIKKAEKWDCKTIVFCALGTGYGNLSEYDFGLAFSVIAGIKCKIEKIYIAHHSAEALKKIESGIYQEKQKLLIFN